MSERGTRFCGAMAIFAVGIYLIAPSAVVAMYSLYPSAYITFPPHGITFKWYATAISQQQLFVQPLLVSLALGMVSAAIATVIGTLAGFGLVRAPLQNRAVWHSLFLAPILIPTLIVGFGLMLFFLNAGVLGSWWALVAGHVTITVAYVTQSVTASLSGLDESVEDAARTLGSSPIRVFFRVTLPQISPGIIAGAMFAFIMSFDELALTLLLASTSTTTLPMAIYSYVQFNSDPTLAAIATILLVITLAFLFMLQRVGGLRRRAY